MSDVFFALHDITNPSILNENTPLNSITVLPDYSKFNNDDLLQNLVFVLLHVLLLIIFVKAIYRIN